MERKIVPFSKYCFCQEIILGSNSFEEASLKIEKRFSDLKIDKSFMWEEYQFLFLLVLVEFRLSEFFGYLYNNKLFKDIEKVIEIVKNKKKGTDIDEKTDEKEKNIFTPYILLKIQGYSLGSLLKMIQEHTLGFKNRQNLIENLEKFNQKRNDFIHGQFSFYTHIDEIIKQGLPLGKSILESLDGYEK